MTARRLLTFAVTCLALATPAAAGVHVSDWSLALPDAPAAPEQFAALEAPGMGSPLAMASSSPFERTVPTAPVG